MSSMLPGTCGSLLFNEVNSDCPGDPEECEFIELVNTDCGGFASQLKTFGAYVLLVEADDPSQPSNADQVNPLVRALFNLTGLTVQERQKYLTMCGDLYSCDAKFWEIEVTSSHPENVPVQTHLNSYLLNGNKFPTVLLLIETENHEDVLRLLPPTVDLPPYFTTQNILTKEKIRFVKQYLRDILVYGKRTPVQGCSWIEELITELSPIRTDAMYASVSYVNREYDHIGYNDMSINRCEHSVPYVLSSPTPGHTNNCQKPTTLLLQPTDKVYAWLAAHVGRYERLAKHVPTGGNCYTTWYSKLFYIMMSSDVAKKREELVEKTAVVHSSSSTSSLVRLLSHSRPFSVGSDDDNCDSPDNKRQRPYLCSQNPNIIIEVEHRCIFDVMRSQSELKLKIFPPLTECGSPGSHDGELLTLSDFDDSDTYQPGADEPNGMNPGTYSTADVIMSRAGFFRGNTHNLKAMKICRHHAHQYNNDFKHYLLNNKNGILRGKGKKIIKCISPMIAGADAHGSPTEVRRNTVINKQQSEAIFRLKGFLLPVGLPVCKTHIEAANNMLIDFAELNRALAPQSSQSYNLRDRSAICYEESSSNGVPVVCRTDSSRSFSPPPSCPPVEPESSLGRSRCLLNVFSKENLVSHWHYTDKYSELSDRTKYNYVKAYKAASNVLLNVLVGQDWQMLKSDVQRASDGSWSRGEGSIETILKQTNRLFNSIDSREQRYIALGVVALNVPYRLLSQHISGVTQYTFTKSRAVVRYYITQQSPPPAPPKLKTPDRPKVDYFLNFVIDNATPKPWGSKLKKLSCGEQIELPAYLSVIRPKKIITEFKAYAKQTLTEDEFKKLMFKSDSTYYGILKKLPLEYRSAATGLDYKTNAGLEGFDTLQSVLCDLMQEKIIDQETMDKYFIDLNEAKRYFRTDFKYHVKKEALVADHDSDWALSDLADPRLRVHSPSSVDWYHPNHCQRCENAKVTFSEIKKLIADVNIQPEKKKRFIVRDVDMAISDIQEMKLHRLRAVHQYTAKTEVLKDLGPTDAFITSDFAQKWLPTSGREDQSAYFGKKGISYHIMHVLMKNVNVFRYKVYQHVFMRQVAQDSVTVMSCLNDTLKWLHDDYGVTGVFLRSDNAGSYHSAKMLTSVLDLNAHGPVTVKRWDFSEPQDGELNIL